MALTGLTGLAPLGSRAGRLRLTPEEEDDLLGQLAGAGTSALGLIGDILGTPGGIIKNIAAGRFEDVIPGIFDPERRISARDLAQQYGLVGEDYEGFDMGDAIGFGVDVALDPFTYVGGGVTKAGNIAKLLGKFPKRSLFDVGTGALKLGKRTARRGTLRSVLEGASDDVLKHAEELAKTRGGTLAEFLDEPMQRSLGVGLPFKENAFTFDLPGAAGRAARLDKLGGYVRSTAPARYLAKMFDVRVNDVGDWAGQRAAMSAFDEAEPAKQAAGADLNRFHMELTQHGIADQDLQTDILEGITRNENAPQGTRLSERDILDYNVQPLPGEAPEALEARKLAIGRTRRAFHDSQEGIRRQREKLGLPAARFESERIDYAPREATFPKYASADPTKRRRDPLRDLGRTEVDTILKDPQLQELARQTDIDPLAPEELTKQVPDEIRQDLANMGYDDLSDLVPWQAKYMRNADPERAAWNAVAETKASVPLMITRDMRQQLADMGFTAEQVSAMTPENAWKAIESKTPRPEMSRTTALPKPQSHTERFQAAVRRVDELLGRDPTDWDRAQGWLDEARQLPRLRRELTELQGKAIAGDYAASLPEQEVAIDLQLGNSIQARDEYLARKERLDLRDIASRDEYLKDDELRELAALRDAADDAPKWRARLKRVQDRIAKGERQIFPAEQIDELNAEIGAAEVAQAQLNALDARAKEARYFVQHAREVPQEAIEKGHRFYGNAALHDATVQRMKDIDKIAFTRQMHKSFAGHVERMTAPPDATKFVPWTDAIRKLGVGRTANEQSHAIRAMAEEMRQAGKLTDDEFANIAGPHAVATSAVKQDPVLAQELRNAEVGDFVKGITGEYEKRVKLLRGKFSGAELEKQLADLEGRFKNARTQGIESINAKPLDDTSHAGRLMQVKRTMHQQLLKASEDARLSGQIDDEALGALRVEADDWLKGKTKGTTEEVQKFQRLWEQVVANDPIPNNGLLMMRNLYVPKDLVDSLANASQFRYAPKQEGFMGWLDWWRNLTKGHLTMPFPSFHVRNVGNMVYQYGSAGVRDPRHGTVKGFIQPWKDAWAILQGKHVKDFGDLPAMKAMGLTGADAERQLVASAESYAGLQGAGDIISEGAEPAFIPHGKREHEWGTTVEQFTAGLPGGRPLNREYILEPLASRFGKQRFNPANREQFVPIAIGARFSNTAENTGRLATYIGLLRQGHSFESAGALTKAMHVDYSSLTQFERSFARRIAPFYSWSRGMVPYVLRQFVEKPGGVYAQTARLARLAQQDAGFLPPQLGGSLAIPLGQEEDGTQRYLSQMDFPVEALNRIVNPASVKDTLRSLLAQTDPTIKAAIELGTDTELFRGRNLSDLDSTTGRIAAKLTGGDEPLWRTNALDMLIANSPLSRYAGGTRQALDPRKDWPAFLGNMASGLKITDVDMDRARSIKAGETARELLKSLGARGIDSVVLPKEQLEKMDPANRAEAERLQAVLRALAREAKERKKAEK